MVTPLVAMVTMILFVFNSGLCGDEKLTELVWNLSTPEDAKPDGRLRLINLIGLGLGSLAPIKENYRHCSSPEEDP
jgi:hypothetical protein